MEKEIRIIPARAGFTPARQYSTWPYPDHPRTRGVYFPGPFASGNLEGSSPHARGLPRNRNSRRSGLGIIPARAGFTCRGVADVLGVPDHPRTRGVYTGHHTLLQCRWGSSPHARGLRYSISVVTHDGGIIPARAGFTAPADRTRNKSSDHPRTRGVYLSYALADTRPTDHPRTRGVYWCLAPRCRPRRGSSPHARGLPLWREHYDLTIRIIPARAGFTVG